MRPRLLLIGAVTVTLVGGFAVPAQATVHHAANGARCTIVGTSGSDYLEGTNHKDVICGLGGNDTIEGRRGDDVLDGGAGNDYVTDYSGTNLFYGGADNDQLYGGGGRDRLAGQSGNDRLYGGPSADQLEGGTGNDVLSAGSGNDRLYGGTGNDRMYAGTGDDYLSGSDGADVLRGDAGRDRLVGGSGNDDLAGGTNVDSYDGGTGTNYCNVSILDGSALHCVVDTKAPVVGAVALSRHTVDVTKADAVVTYRVHLTDDTGVDPREVTIGARSEDGVVSAYWPTGAELVSGTVRDGVWSGRLRIYRWSPQTALGFEVWVRDRGWRGTVHEGSKAISGAIKVLDSTPDITPPTLRKLTMSPTVDTRTSTGKLSVRAWMTDARAGVDSVNLILASTMNGSYVQNNVGGWPLTLLSGTVHNGIWGGTFAMPKRSLAGRWEVDVSARDRAHTAYSSDWLGPQFYAQVKQQYPTDPVRAVPNGGGSFTVLGVTDAHAPQVRSVTISPGQVDVSTQNQQVTVEVRLTDDTGIVTAYVSLANADQTQSSSGNVSPTLLSGTVRDGVWRVSPVLPRGTPPGTYYLTVELWDMAHSTRLTSSPTPSPGWSTIDLLGGAGTLVVTG